MKEEYGALVEHQWQGTDEVLGDELVPLSLCTRESH